MNATPSTKDLFSEVHHLLQIFLTILATTSTSKEHFQLRGD